MRMLVKVAQRHVLGDTHASDASILERFFGKTVDTMFSYLGAAGEVGLAMDADLARRRRPLPRQNLDQLALAVTGYAGDTNDLARMDLKVHIIQRLEANV